MLQTYGHGHGIDIDIEIFDSFMNIDIYFLRNREPESHGLKPRHFQAALDPGSPSTTKIPTLTVSCKAFFKRFSKNIWDILSV